MRSTIGVVLLAVVAAFYIWQEVPAPPSIAVQPLTPETIRAEFAREQKQKQYDSAQAVIVRFAVQHKGHIGVDVAEALAHAAVDFPVLRSERSNARLYAALAYYESGFRSNANSVKNSVGLLQINPKIWKKYSVKQLLDPYLNASYGASILSGYVHSYGLFQGLHRYNGLGPKSKPTDDSYAVAVFQLAGFDIPADAEYGT